METAERGIIHRIVGFRELPVLLAELLEELKLSDSIDQLPGVRFRRDRAIVRCYLASHKIISFLLRLVSMVVSRKKRNITSCEECNPPAI